MESDLTVHELPPNKNAVRVRFRGVVYRRYPGAKKSSDRNYFRAGLSDKYKGRTYLHRDLWVACHGPIPDTHEVDHKDRNPLNNVLENLQLLTIEDHKQKHAAESTTRSRERLAAMPLENREEMLRRAADWHASDEGRAWHSEHAKRIAASIPMADATCEFCGKSFQVKANFLKRTRVCSNNCKSALRRKEGKDNETRECPCGTQYVVSRFSRNRTCSRACGQSYPKPQCAGVQPHG